MKQKKKNVRLAIIIVAIIVCVVALVFWRIWAKADAHQHAIENRHITGTILNKPLPLPKMSLQRAGKPHFTNDNFRGHWTLLFFGFTNCPYVCPTTMRELEQMVILLKQNDSAVEPPEVVMVSVDPKRDTTERMQTYVKRFNSNFIGVRTTPAKTKRLADAMKVSFARVIAGNDAKRYTVTHSATIMVINPKGQLQAYLSYPHVAAEMAHDFRVIRQAYEGS